MVLKQVFKDHRRILRGFEKDFKGFQRNAKKISERY